MKGNSTFQNLIYKRDDLALLKLFHTFPFISTISNILVTAMFVTAFFVLYELCRLLIGSALVVIGAALVVLLQCYLPVNGRTRIAKVFKARYQTESDTHTSPYFYLVRREKELKGSYTAKSSEKVFFFISLAFRIINYVFNLATALACTMITGVLAFLFGGVSYVIAILSNSSIMLNIAKFFTFPFKWTVTFFLKNALIPGSIGESNLSKYAQEGTDSALQQNLSFKEYFSLGELTLPSAYASLHETFNGTAVTVSGTVTAKKLVYDNPSNLYSLQRGVEGIIQKRFDAASQKFHRDCPNAGSTHLHIDIQYLLEA